MVTQMQSNDFAIPPKKKSSSDHYRDMHSEKNAAYPEFSDIYSDMLSDILSGICTDIYFAMCSIYSDIFSGILFGILSAILSGILAGILAARIWIALNVRPGVLSAYA